MELIETFAQSQSMAPKHDFGKGLRMAMKVAGLSQEDFSNVSSRTYVSSLERGLNTPTLEKVEDLAEAVGCHPLTLAALAYLKQPTNPADRAALFDLIDREIDRMTAEIIRVP